MDSCDLLVTNVDFDFPNMHSIAPYMDKIMHVSTSENGLKYTSLRENICLVAKWFT